MSLTLEDIENVESNEQAMLEDEIRAYQRAINAGQWSLQGSWGRAMMGAIESGYCILGTKPAHDYWGNGIPSRTWLKKGTKGTIEYARAQQPAFWKGRKTNWTEVA